MGKSLCKGGNYLQARDDNSVLDVVLTKDGIGLAGSNHIVSRESGGEHSQIYNTLVADS